jgi:Flp pilus assembly protein TadG
MLPANKSTNTLRRRAHSRRTRRGAIVVLIAVCLTVILAFVAIAVDGGGLLERRRQAQAVADAAALAAAENLFVNYPANKGVDSGGTAQTYALAIAAANGFNNDGTRSIVSVRTYPQTYSGGPNQGATLPKGYVEVAVQYNQPRFFSAVIGSGDIAVPARAVARGEWKPAMVGIHVLDLHQKGSFNVTGESMTNVTGGAAIIVNSDDPQAAITNGGTVIADNMRVTGGTNSTGGKGGFFGDVETGTEPQPDPLRGIRQPLKTDYAVASQGPKHFSNGNHTLSPGVYNGGITISGKASVTMLPGIYYIAGGGFKFSGQGSLTANGVMIYNDPKQPSDDISITGSGGGSVTMTPPASGLYKGMTLFQNRSATNTMTVSGNGGFYVTGTFYAANALINVNGGGAGKIGSQFISRFLELGGNGALNIDYNPEQTIPRRVWGLVE